MKPIVLIAVAGVLSSFMGVGFLAPGIEDVWLQNVGVGDETLETPLDHINVDLDIAPILSEDADDNPIWKNKFVSCSFHAAVMPQQNNEDAPLEAVICKLRNAEGEDVVEGRLNFVEADGNTGPQGLYLPSTHYTISPLTEANPGDANIDNINDVRIVVIGNNPAWVQEE